MKLKRIFNYCPDLNIKWNWQNNLANLVSTVIVSDISPNFEFETLKIEVEIWGSDLMGTSVVEVVQFPVSIFELSVSINRYLSGTIPWMKFSKLLPEFCFLLDDLQFWLSFSSSFRSELMKLLFSSGVPTFWIWSFWWFKSGWPRNTFSKTDWSKLLLSTPPITPAWNAEFKKFYF